MALVYLRSEALALQSEPLRIFMFKFLLALIIVALITPFCPAQNSNDAQRIAAVKAAVAKIGTGKDARVQVIRVGQPKVNGFINDIRDDDFEVISSDNGSIGVTINISYSEVVRIKGKSIDWRNGAIKTSWFGLKAFKVMVVVLKGACLGPISRCSP